MKTRKSILVGLFRIQAEVEAFQSGFQWGSNGGYDGMIITQPPDDSRYRVELLPNDATEGK